MRVLLLLVLSIVAFGEETKIRLVDLSKEEVKELKEKAEALAKAGAEWAEVERRVKGKNGVSNGVELGGFYAVPASCLRTDISGELVNEYTQLLVTTRSYNVCASSSSDSKISFGTSLSTLVPSNVTKEGVVK